MEGSEVTFDFKDRQVFFSANDDRPNQIRPGPGSMIALLANQMTADFFEELLKFFVMDRSEGSHRLGGNWDLDFSALLADDSGRNPLFPYLFPTVLSQDLAPGTLLRDLPNEKFEGLGKRPLSVLEGVPVGNEIKSGRVTEKRITLLQINHWNICFNGSPL